MFKIKEISMQECNYQARLKRSLSRKQFGTYIMIMIFTLKGTIDLSRSLILGITLWLFKEEQNFRTQVTATYNMDQH